MDRSRRRDLVAYLAEMRAKGCVVGTSPEMGLAIPRQAFEDHMMIEVDGVELLRRLEQGHWREAERCNLIRCSRESCGPVFQVPDWTKLVEFLRSVT